MKATRRAIAAARRIAPGYRDAAPIVKASEFSAE
jgi:hypothetical protein